MEIDMKPDIVFPLIHTNGTHPDELIQQQREIKLAASILYKALADACPHARDYYPLGNDIAAKAYEEHKQRLIAVAQIKQDADRTISRIYRQTGRKPWVDSPEEIS